MTRVLILGGSWFLGHEIAEQAVARDWEVTKFRRGHTGTDVYGMTTVRGDRTNPDDRRRLAEAGPWDVIVDTSSFVPRETLRLTRVPEPVAARYVLVSTVSVYAGWPIEALREESEVLNCPSDAGPDFGYDGDPGPSIYGFGKAGCERAVIQTFGPDRTGGAGSRRRATRGTIRGDCAASRPIERLKLGHERSRPRRLPGAASRRQSEDADLAVYQSV